ncbi:MAG: NAD(P)H-dependent oxidoreductase [Rhodocyclaceae bacterium]|nr:NAD(P)H-dependent oxidoreductase [Rhodocyclaceae bacterium]
MKCLVVVAHPLPESLCHALAGRAVAALRAAGHEVAVEDLYARGFPAALTAAERSSYYAGPFDGTAVQGEIDRLRTAEGLVLCFPTWWFGFPAVLKGWFDRAWAPGAAYDHADDLGAIRPRLTGLRRALAVTSLGSPWWVDRLVLRQPVKRVLKTALLGTCAPHCRLQMLSLYKAERLDEHQAAAFGARVARTLAAWR